MKGKSANVATTDKWHKEHREWHTPPNARIGKFLGFRFVRQLLWGRDKTQVVSCTLPAVRTRRGGTFSRNSKVCCLWFSEEELCSGETKHELWAALYCTFSATPDGPLWLGGWLLLTRVLLLPMGGGIAQCFLWVILVCSHKWLSPIVRYRKSSDHP
jgi:hypothetical protein